MSIETALRLSLSNQPGALAHVAEQLGEGGVNIRAVAGVASNGEGQLEFIVDNAAEASRAWRAAGISFEEVQVVLVWLDDTPGTLGRACRALAAAGINIESAYITGTAAGRAQVAFECADATKADELLTGLAQG